MELGADEVWRQLDTVPWDITRNLWIILPSVSEGHEVNSYRSRMFKRERFVDFDVSSSFVHLRKSDRDTFRVASYIAQVPVSKPSISKTSRCLSKSQKA
jgi:hypothetical protein